jgi:hypothetical protein
MIAMEDKAFQNATWFRPDNLARCFWRASSNGRLNLPKSVSFGKMIARMTRLKGTLIVVKQDRHIQTGETESCGLF